LLPRLDVREVLLLVDNYLPALALDHPLVDDRELPEASPDLRFLQEHLVPLLVDKLDGRAPPMLFLRFFLTGKHETMGGLFGFCSAMPAQRGSRSGGCGAIPGLAAPAC